MLVLPPRLFPSAAYYQAMALAGKCAIAAWPYDKRDKEAHRYTIVDNRGTLQLTVPLSKPHTDSRPGWADCPVSTHDRWWEKHRAALETAYGRTPYFEFLIDRFDRVLRSPEQWDAWPSAVDLMREANRAVTSILGIDTEPEYLTDTTPRSASTSPEPRHVTGAVEFHTAPPEKPYWQVRQHLFGFTPGLSVLDIIFNLGPEATLHLGLRP